MTSSRQPSLHYLQWLAASRVLLKKVRLSGLALDDTILGQHAPLPELPPGLVADLIPDVLIFSSVGAVHVDVSVVCTNAESNIECGRVRNLAPGVKIRDYSVERRENQKYAKYAPAIRSFLAGHKFKPCVVASHGEFGASTNSLIEYLANEAETNGMLTINSFIHYARRLLCIRLVKGNAQLSLSGLRELAHYNATPPCLQRPSRNDVHIRDNARDLRAVHRGAAALSIPSENARTAIAPYHGYHF